MTPSLKAVHVEDLSVREEFLEVLLPGRVAFEKVDGILPSGLQLAHPCAPEGNQRFASKFADVSL